MTNKQQQAFIEYLLIQCCDKRDYLIQYKEFCDYSRMLESHTELLCILEMAEVLDCGSVGGFGKGQPSNSKPCYRLNWLLNKYNLKHLIKPF